VPAALHGRGGGLPHAALSLSLSDPPWGPVEAGMDYIRGLPVRSPILEARSFCVGPC